MLGRRAAAPSLRAVARSKHTTGLVGIPVVPDAKAVLERLYTKTLAEISAFPATAEYRKTVESLCNERLAVVRSTDSLVEIEKKVGAGQVEQLIMQAHDELNLLPTLLEARVWETYDGPPAEDLYIDLKRRGIVLQRYDIPMLPSLDYPTAERVELIEPAPEPPPVK